MHERLVSISERLTAGALGLALALGGAACKADETSTAPLIERCFDVAQPDPVQEAAPPPTTDIRIGSNGYAEGDPVALDAAVKSRVVAGLVDISVRGSRGALKATGWATTGLDNRTYIVTAAHVAEKAHLSDISVTADGRQSSGVSDGCYTYENDGQLQDLHTGPKKTPVDSDVAILALSTPLSTLQPLHLATEAPQVGQWGFAVNYQGAHKPNRPATYTMYLSGTPPNNTFGGVTGLRDKPNMTQAEHDDLTLIGGGSGGPLLNSKGEVIGITSSSTGEKFYKTPSELQNAAHIRIAGVSPEEFGPKGGLEPGMAHMTGIPAIAASLTSPRIRDSRPVIQAHPTSTDG